MSPKQFNSLGREEKEKAFGDVGTSTRPSVVLTILQNREKISKMDHPKAGEAVEVSEKMVRTVTGMEEEKWVEKYGNQGLGQVLKSLMETHR